MSIRMRGDLIAAVSMAALAAASIPSNATAQDAGDSANSETVVVTGFRQSLAAALDVKRDSSGIVDAIVAEDIASFPDLNLAESIQRVPGISIDRVAGEGRNITVRGLTGDYTRIRINSMEALSTSGASDSSGGSNRGRAFDFNTFAADLFNSITVRKTTSADIDEGSLGATVDLRTARPFDYDAGFTGAASAQFGWNDLSEETSPRYAGLASWTNTDQTFGVLASVAYSDRTILEEGFSTVRWQDGNFRSVNGVACPAGPDCAAIDTNSLIYHPRIPRYGRLTHEQERTGVTLAAQWRPTERTEVSADLLYANFDGTRDEEYLEVFFRSQEGNIDVNSFTIDQSNNTLNSGNFDISQLSNGTHPVRSEHRYDELETDFVQFTLEVEHEFTDTFRGHVIAGTVSSEFSNPVQTTVFADAVGEVSGYVYDFTQGSDTPYISFGSLDVTDPSQFAFTEFRDRPQSVDNSFDTIAGDLSYDFTPSLTLSGGVSWKRFEFETTEFRRESTFGSRVCDYGGYDCMGATGAPITGDLVGYVDGFGSGLGLPSGVDTRWLSPNVQAAAALVGLYDIPGAVQAGNNRSVEEEDTGFWLQLDFETALGSVPVRGDVGVRYVETETSATGILSTETVTVDSEYTDTLPSANVTFELTPDFYIRTGIAKVMARPSLGNLTPGGSLDSFTGPPYSYNAGNPFLDPYRATNYDVSFEWYFQEEALLSLGLFYKDVSNFFSRNSGGDVPYSQTGLPISAAPASSPLRVALDAGQDPLVDVSQIANGGGGEVQGVEIIYQQPFTFLPAPFDDFGFQGNYTYVDSDTILGFSPNAFNATLYYEGERLAARISGAYRDAYRTDRPSTAPSSLGRNERGVDSSFNLDFSSSYEITEGLQVTFEAINLTDEFENQIFDSGDLVNVHHHTGTEYLFGVRWRN